MSSKSSRVASDDHDKAENVNNRPTKTPPTTITREELLQLRQECLDKIRQEELYRLRNDAKLRAVYSTQSYEEFKDIVDAAHLTAVNKKDKMNASTRDRLWNTAAKNNVGVEEK